MSSEVKHEAKDWLLNNEYASIGALDRPLSGALVGALYQAGGPDVSVHIVDPDEDGCCDRIHVTAGVLVVANVMSRLANFYPKNTKLLPCSVPGCHIVEAWWEI